MSELTGVRFSLDDLRAIEDWRRTRPTIPAKGTAIRELVRLGLEFSRIQDTKRQKSKD